MTRTEALKRIAELHEQWSLEHGDEVPNLGGDPVWQADQFASSDIDDPLNEQITAILAKVTP